MNLFTMFAPLNAMMIARDIARGGWSIPHSHHNDIDEHKTKTKPMIVVDSNGNVMYEEFTPLYSTKPLIVR